VFELLAAVLLSAQATDVSVNKATRELFALAPTPQKMLALGEERVTEQIRTIGLFRTKAARTCCHLPHPGGPARRPGAAFARGAGSLPGVGRKTANVVLNVAFGEPTMAVDTHVFRVSNRTGLAPGRNPLEVEVALLRRVPALPTAHAHHWLILHGRYVCTGAPLIAGPAPCATGAIKAASWPGACLQCRRGRQGDMAKLDDLVNV
jgi:endonuclease-3